MKAQFVNESINFERGQDPKRAMEIGGISLIKKYDWDVDVFNNIFYEFISVADFVEDWKGYPILVVKVKDKQTGEIGYYAVSDGGIGCTNFNIYGAHRPLKNIKRTINKRVKAFESLDFERGKDPKTAMDLGAKAILNPRSLENITGEHPHSNRIARDIIREFGFPILPLSEIYLIWGAEDTENYELEKVLDPYVNGNNVEILSQTNYGAGVTLIKLNTSHGILIREFSKMGTDNIFATFDTIMNLNIIRYLG